MQTLTFPTEGQFVFALSVLSTLSPAFTGAVHAADRLVEVGDREIASLLERITNHLVTVLPLAEEKRDVWLLLAPDRYHAERAWSHVCHFVLPSYGVLPHWQSGSFDPFAERTGAISMAAKAGYGGYIEWHAPAYERHKLLSRLSLWAKADANRPSLAMDRPPAYQQLFGDFTSALAAMNWREAAAVLGEMRRLHLTDFDNLTYLQIQLLAQQGKWEEIWQERSFATMAAQQLPRLVRTALIEAFHHTVLLKLEQMNDFDGALAQFQAKRAKLGMLLTGRFSSNNSAVLRVFAYQATCEQDRQTLEQMLSSPAVDPEAHRVIDALWIRLPLPVQQVEPPALRLLQAMRLRNYDMAAAAALELDHRIERAVALLRIAYRHPDAAELALAEYEALNAEEIRQVEEEEPATNLFLQHILGVGQPTKQQINSWPEWFESLLMAPHDQAVGQALEQALDKLSQQVDDRLWTPDNVRLIESRLSAFLNQAAPLLYAGATQRGMNTFIDLLLADAEFPRQGQDYAELYERLFDWMVLAPVANEANGKKLLRLADANLRIYPTHIKQIAKEACKWFERPTLALEELLLGVIDLLISNGVERQDIFQLFRVWLAHLLDLPSTVTWQRTSKEVWLSIGEWLQPGDDLLNTLRRQLARAAINSEPNKLSRIPAGSRIAIFTLNPAAARRASDIIRQHNPQVTIEICNDTVLTESAKRLAGRADLPVIVTSCLTHALFYGIGPYLQVDPIYPAFQGATSIVRALEDFTEKL